MVTRHPGWAGVPLSVNDLRSFFKTSHMEPKRRMRNLIGIDWGTSSFRAFLLDNAGVILEKRSSQDGILSVRKGAFAETLLAKIGDWLRAGESRILLSGMVGSQHGWIETEYLPCPVGISDLVGSVVKVPFECAVAMLVPGVAGTDSSGVPEVMRGEETQIMGILNAADQSYLVCLPGTHSKWVTLSNRTILSFTTFMTGEIFALLHKHSILGRDMESGSDFNKEAFLQGVTRSAESGGLLHHLFGVRTLGLMNQLAVQASTSYLSGLLIGHEVRTAMPRSAHVYLIGEPSLCSCYAQAITICGGTCTLGDEDAAARGLSEIGRRISWN
jgi:2-dehydro-3-deoxygalactonokinase